MLGIYPTTRGIYPLAQGKYCNIPLSAISTVELYRSKAKPPSTMITVEEERRILAAAAISASAAAFRRCRRPSSKHCHCSALMPPDCRRTRICATIAHLPPFPFLFPPPMRWEGGAYFREEAINLAYNLHGIDPGGCTQPTSRAMGGW
jgi:hypothetical protein